MLSGLQKAFGKVQLIVVWSWRMYLQVPVLLSRLLCLHFAHQRRVVFEGSAAAPSAYVHSNIARSGFGVVLVRLVMQDAMRAVFDVWPEVRIPVYANDKTFNV